MKILWRKFYDAGASGGAGGTDAVLLEVKAASDAVNQFKTEQAQALELVKKELETTKGELKEVKAANVTRDEADKLNQKALDEMIARQKDFSLGGNINKDSFNEALKTELKSKENELREYKQNRNGINIQLKAVGDIAAGSFTTSGTQTWAGPTMLPGVNRIAYAQNRMREILGTTAINTDSVAVIRGVAGEGAPTSVGVGGLKPQSDADWLKVIVPVTKIAHYYTIPEEYLEDISWLADDITQTGVAELMKLENSKIISNTAGAGEFGGLIQNSTAYASPSGLALGIDLANNYDVLVAAMTQMRNANREPNFIITDNDSYAKMILTKATGGEYVFGAPNVSMPNVFGVPIYPMNVSTLADKFIVGDRNYATVAVRSGISVRFYDQHANNAIYNLVTVVIEERLALVVKRTDAFIYGDFSDARTALETA